MGNSHNKGSEHRDAKKTAHSDREGQAYTSQFSLSQFVGNLSGRSLASVASAQSTSSAARPWSRISRRRWNDSTLRSPLEASKTAWPVAHKESIFLPEFPISTDLLQKDFEIIEHIAKGAFGEVCRVVKLSVNKEYALKVLHKSQIISENAVRQVKQESHIQQVCGHHPALVAAAARWQTKKRLYILSEYIPGGELLALLDKYGKLPEELVKLFVAEIAVAIDFLHNSGVIHRDIKPENILLDASLHARLADFGLAKWLSAGARTNTLCGTLKYMAPEVLSGEPYGHAADWWSLGVLACRMLTNEYPSPAVAASSADQAEATDGEIDADTGQSNGTGQRSSCEQPAGRLPDSVASLSKGARALLMRLCDRDPRQRMRSLRQLQQSAFYMGYNFDHIKNRKVSPKSILEKYFPDGPVIISEPRSREDFTSFDQPCVF
ncbi:serine/threonine-protein kinase S6KL isoform X2 [Plutella xylostella]|uniref:serine/threonine-protein kinase S6KL isoform X2 n=1 Tax=Plutella xylostella TaxID=51655 RepID=UPI0020329235|nr:serine/threonine-protein kinase S6KL isoform X2 [Plutella xylostella]